MKYKINVIVKMWFDAVNGNTYHNVNFNYNDKNYNSIMNFIANRLDINIKKYTEKPITIKVGSK